MCIKMHHFKTKISNQKSTGHTAPRSVPLSIGTSIHSPPQKKNWYPVYATGSKWSNAEKTEVVEQHKSDQKTLKLEMWSVSKCFSQVFAEGRHYSAERAIR